MAAVLLVATLACPAGVLRANGIYKSVDAQGHVVYSDQPDLAAPQSTVVATSNDSSGADLEVRVTEAPPLLPDEQQPPCPEDGDLWTPGFWAWSAAGYYWVPGTWVPPPRVGLLWTPGYWVYVDAVYLFHRGYWAPRVGYYGGIHYGFGYPGQGFVGGRWLGNSFAYNRTASNVDPRIVRGIYSEPVDDRGVRTRVSYNNGPGGTIAAPSAQELAFAAQSHVAPTALQRQALAQAARVPTLVAPRASYRVTPEPAVMQQAARTREPDTLASSEPARPPSRVAAPVATPAQQPVTARARAQSPRHIAPTGVSILRH
jgi:Domain of unknown function (DUF4124)/WXXGXW repeat (2 copies)